MFTVGYRAWWHRFIPSKRKQKRIVEAIVNHIAEKPEFQQKVNKAVLDKFLYGIEPDFAAQERSDPQPNKEISND